MLLLASALFLGAALGLRYYNVFVLVPASLLTAGAAFAVSFAGGGSFDAALLVTAVSVTSLQSGYLAGVTVFRRDVDDINIRPEASIDHAYKGADVVYLNRHWLAKTR